MDLNFQISSIDQLKKLAASNRHSILISGIPGIGKTYLASQFAAIKKIPTFNIVQPKVQELKQALDDSYRLNDEQVVCIENLDRGVQAAAQVILKYLEEPLPNTYVIVTANNSAKLPETILSRAIQLDMKAPSVEDLGVYAKAKNSAKWEIISKYKVSKVCKSLSDIDDILALSLDYIKYYESLLDTNFYSQSLDQISWGLKHYPDNSVCNAAFAFRVIQRFSPSYNLRKLALESLLSLEAGKVGESATLSKFALECKLM